MRESRKFCQRGSNTDVFIGFFFIRGKGIQIALNAGHNQPAFKWRFADGPMMAQIEC